MQLVLVLWFRLGLLSLWLSELGSVFPVLGSVSKSGFRLGLLSLWLSELGSEFPGSVLELA